MRLRCPRKKTAQISATIDFLNGGNMHKSMLKKEILKYSKTMIHFVQAKKNGSANPLFLDFEFKCLKTLN